MDDGLKIIIIMLISGIVAYFIGSFFIVTYLGISSLNFDLRANLVFMFFSTILGFIPLWVELVVGSYLKKLID